jgi:hypothetical protein
MPNIRAALALLLCGVLIAVSLGAETQTHYDVIYSGGSFPTVKCGEDMKLYFDVDQVRLVWNHDQHKLLLIKASAITEISYGQEVPRRVGTAIGLGVISLWIGGLMAFSKSKKDYIGLILDDGNGKKAGLLFQADTNESPGVVAALEGVTGKTAVNADGANLAHRELSAWR